MPVVVDGFAGWQFTASIPSLQSGGGMQIDAAFFQGTSVIYRAGQPFALVDYHNEPGAPSPTYKDGFQNQGAPFGTLAPYVRDSPNYYDAALNDNAYDPLGNPRGGIMVEYLDPTFIEPAKVVVWAKYQCGWYQYVHRWEFGADGVVNVVVGLGGGLYPSVPGRVHIHNFYFRLDLDIVEKANNQVEEYQQLGWTSGSSVTGWVPYTTSRAVKRNYGNFTKWRVSHAPTGRSYEIIPGAPEGGPDGRFSTNDLWALTAAEDRGPGPVGVTDAVLNGYATGAAFPDDTVVYYVLRNLHVPRNTGEERSGLPYMYLNFMLAPRNFLTDTLREIYDTIPPSP